MAALFEASIIIFKISDIVTQGECITKILFSHHCQGSLQREGGGLVNRNKQETVLLEDRVRVTSSVGAKQL